MNRTGLVATMAAASLLLAACGGDDGATVRDLGADGVASASGSASASASGAASGSASGSASGVASASASGTASGSDAAADSDGGYEYASDVNAHRLVTRDLCDINALLDAETIDFEAVEAIYRDGVHSVNSDGSVRSLAGFATATDRLHGLDSYYGTETPLDDFVTSALDATGPFEGASDAVRRQGVQKGLVNQVMLAWVEHELVTALDKAADGDLDPASGAPHNWDEAWAFYHGAEPDCAPYATANSRAANFGTSNEEGIARANAQVLDAMVAGRDALLAGDVSGAEAAAEEVRRAVFVTYSQAAIRYATLAAAAAEEGEADEAKKSQAEGLAFWRVIEAPAAAVGADVSAVNAIFDLATEPGAGGTGDDVRAALQSAWDAFGIDPEDIGELE